MNTHTLDGFRAATSGFVPAIVDAALNRWQWQYLQALAMPTGADAEHAVRAERLAELTDRRSRWWDVLAAWTYRNGSSVPFVYGDAAQHCASKDRDSARFWRESAADWWARAEHRPTSDAAGALSNHDELEVMA